MEILMPSEDEMMELMRLANLRRVIRESREETDRRLQKSLEQAREDLWISQKMLVEISEQLILLERAQALRHEPDGHDAMLRHMLSVYLERLARPEMISGKDPNRDRTLTMANDAYARLKQKCQHPVICVFERQVGRFQFVESDILICSRCSQWEREVPGQPLKDLGHAPHRSFVYVITPTPDGKPS